MFLFGTDFLIKFALVLTQVIETDLLDLHEESEILKYFNEILKYPLSSDCENLSQKCSINTLIQKAIKVHLMASFIKEKYIKEEEQNFDEILKYNKKVYDLSLSPLTKPNSLHSIKLNNKEEEEKRFSMTNQSNLNTNTNRSPCDDNRVKKKILTRYKYRPEIILENNIENYDENMEEEGDNELSTEIDLRKSITRTSNKIVQNLNKYQYDFSVLKSELDKNQSDINQLRHRKQNSHNLFNYNPQFMMKNNHNIKNNLNNH